MKSKQLFLAAVCAGLAINVCAAPTLPTAWSPARATFTVADGVISIKTNDKARTPGINGTFRNLEPLRYKVSFQGRLFTSSVRIPKAPKTGTSKVPSSPSTSRKASITAAGPPLTLPRLISELCKSTISPLRNPSSRKLAAIEHLSSIVKLQCYSVIISTADKIA